MNHRQPSDASHFRELRMRLVECGRNLRHARDDYETVKAQREYLAVSSGQAGGKNADERERSLTIFLATDSAHISALALLRDAEYEHERVEALLEAAKDERRAAEWQVRAKLADGLFNRGVPSDADDPTGDSAFDDATDRQIEDDLYVKTSDAQRHMSEGEWNGPYPPIDDLPF